VPVAVEETIAPVEIPVPVAEQAFDPHSISQEVFDSTKVDIKKFIENLNELIRSKNYKAWVSYLSDDYITERSSAEFLTGSSDMLMRSRDPSKRRKLNTLEDYFLYVVVPSRANDRVDDIEFITQTRIKALTIAPNGERLRLYELENSQNTCKIIN
jgi:hypothetical protein